MAKLMEYRGYHATVEYDAEDRIFVGKVFGITDSLNFHGTTVDELENMFHQSIDNYLSLCKEIGKEPDKEFKGSFNVRLSPDLHRRVALRAAEENLTLNQYVIQSLEKALKPEMPSGLVAYMPITLAKAQWLGSERDNFSSEYNMKEIPFRTFNEVVTYVAQ